jgi:hypothetical protein
MSDVQQQPSDENPRYAYKPSLLGAGCEFELLPDALHWQIGGRSGRIRYDAIRRVRMSFRPATMQSQRFVTEIRADGHPKIQIASTSWRSMVEQERLDRGYGVFVAELHRRLAAAGSSAQFLAGMPKVPFWIGAVVFGGTMVAMLFVVMRALQSNQLSRAVIVGLFFAVFGFQLGNYFRRNRPHAYRPDAPPQAVMPRSRERP